MAFYDADTTARFQTPYGRPLHTFLTPNDAPSVNGYVDANFLRRSSRTTRVTDPQAAASTDHSARQSTRAEWKPLGNVPALPVGGLLQH